MNKKLIKKLRKGTIAVVNDGALEELREVLKCAFPNDTTKISGSFKYYYKYDDKSNCYEWGLGNETDLPTHSVKEFLTTEKQIMKVTDLKENECIHCETEEQANAICKLMHEAGLKWNSEESYLSENKYNFYISKTCYFPKSGQYAYLDYAKELDFKIYKAEQFLKQKIKTMSAIVNINPDTSEINITPKEGFEIDVENSDLKNGKVLFKEVEKKYPNKITGLKFILLKPKAMSDKYGDKLEILDTLLCLRDEYNKIDGFTEGFRFEEENFCITPYKKNLEITRYYVLSRIMHFGKGETAELFLHNFKEQLEQIKEFL